MKYVLHVDGDSFFASCEVARIPKLKNKAVVVGEDRGIASAMTREAKELGITRGMPIFEIKRDFPEVTILPSHFELYEHYARNLYKVLKTKIDTVERYSIDECFGLVHFEDEIEESEILDWLKNLKKEVQDKIGITYSFGLARTKVLAKVASKLNKPDGCTVLFERLEEEVLRKTPIESIWGIGWSLSKRFKALNIKTAYEFSTWTPEKLERSFALPTKELWYELKGERMFQIGEIKGLPKSLQSTKSFSPFSSDLGFVTAELLKNLDIVFRRMRKYGVVTKFISVYLKTKDRRYYSTYKEFSFYTDNPISVIESIKREVEIIFKPSIRYKSTGVTVHGLIDNSRVPKDLFGEQDKLSEKLKFIETVDAIRRKYGNSIIDFLAVRRSTIDREGKSKAVAKKDTFLKGLPLPYLGEVV